MAFDDDSDDLISSSSADSLESSAKAKREALMKQLEKKGQKDLANRPGAANLSGLKLAVLKQQREAKKEKAPTKTDEAKLKQGSDMTTKTREQEIAAAKLSADAKPTAGGMVEQGNADEKAQEEIRRSETQSEDA